MRPLLIGLVFVLAVCGCSGSSSAADIRISLTITVWKDGPDYPSYEWTLRCNPLGGTLPHGDRACYFLAVDPDPFAPVPKDRVCAQVYGGPGIAVVRGTYRGRRVWAKFRRNDACQTARWERVKYLFAAPRRPS